MAKFLETAKCKNEWLILRDIPHDIYGVDDVEVVLLEKCNSESWGYYFPGEKLIKLYIKDEYDKIYDMEYLVKALLHELAHHLQYKKRVPSRGQEHNRLFKMIHRQLLETYFEGRIPDDIVNLVKEEGNWIER